LPRYIKKIFASGAGGWGSNPEPIKSPTRCQRLATVATLIVWALVQSRVDRHRKGIKRV